ncbi:MAG: hypothetical protein EA377_09255 [Phycisphaerales bacterium]|nr:MAG: hypothetical protein EA377_09255 [Phycisphaerales bacterium]
MTTMLKQRRLRFQILLVSIASMTAIGFGHHTSPTSAAAWPGDDPAAERAERTERFLRVDEKPGKTITLEIATRRYRPVEGDGPLIGLVGVAHIGERDFYLALQEELDRYDIVLYEVVSPDGARGGIVNDPQKRAEATRARLQLLAGMIEDYRLRHGRYPVDLESLRRDVTEMNTVMANWVRSASIDAWGDRVMYETDEEGAGFQLFRDVEKSLENELRVTEADEVPALPLEDENIQTQLAKAINLAFQFDEVDYDAPHWRQSDMTHTMFRRALKASGADVDPSAEMLMGTSFSARVAEMLLRMVRMLDRMTDGAVADMVKVFMIELLGDETIIEAAKGQMGEAFADILIDQRNDIVLSDLERIMREEQHVESIAVFYGAAHMDHFAESIKRDFAYELDGASWYPAIRVDLEQSRVDQRQLQQIRMMLRRSFRQMAQ